MQGTLQLKTSGWLASGADPESDGSYWQHQLLFGHLTGQFRFMKKPASLQDTSSGKDLVSERQNAD
jgi:hypothetical protein